MALLGGVSRSSDSRLKIFQVAGNKPGFGSVLNMAASVAFETVSKG
jgi:hypothetical protein